MRKRVYKFMCPQYGISNLEKKRLKLSTIEGEDDPFDFFAVSDSTDPNIRHAIIMLRAQLRKEIGLLCFSRSWDNLLLWSHYAASHTGFCLGFDILQRGPGINNDDTDVFYQLNHVQIRRRRQAQPVRFARVLMGQLFQASAIERSSPFFSAAVCAVASWPN
jgi:hypothetical protein